MLKRQLSCRRREEVKSIGRPSPAIGHSTLQELLALMDFRGGQLPRIQIEQEQLCYRYGLPDSDLTYRPDVGRFAPIFRQTSLSPPRRFAFGYRIGARMNLVFCPPKRKDLRYLRSVAKKIVAAAGLRSELSFTSFRHGGLTEGADSDLTDAELRAAARHRSSQQLPTYAKRTRRQLISGCKKRRAERTKAAHRRLLEQQPNTRPKLDH